MQRSILSTSTGKENKTFMILSALGILFVVDDHLGRPFSIFTHVFHYDSFYMPMFVFISGYFFRSSHVEDNRKLLQFTIKKTKKLLIPYLGWILFYGVAIALLRPLGLCQFGSTSLRDLVYNIVTSGTSFGFNDSAWFVPMLFCVILLYAVLRRFFRKHWNNYAAMVVFALLGAGAVRLSHTELRVPLMYHPLKTAFFLQFFQLGVLYHDHLEHWFNQKTAVSVCTGAVSINILLQWIWGEGSIAFPLCATMSGFAPNVPACLPLVTSVTGIAFWLKISNALVPIWGKNTIVNQISSHTSFFMTHHLTVKQLFLWILAFASNCGVESFRNIDVHQICTDPWYNFTDYKWCSVACFLFTITILVACCNLLELAKEKRSAV